MSSLRRLQHVDRKHLYTSLEARIQYLHSFLDFNSDDIRALTLGAKYLRPLLPSIVELTYKKLLQYDITAAAFATRSTSYSSDLPIDETPSENSPQIQYRKLFLRGYLQKLCSDPSKMDFWAYLDKVGMMHTGRGKKKSLNVEFVHIGATLGFLQDVLVEAVLTHPRLKMERKIAVVRALGKVLWIQNDLFAKWYVRDGEEFAAQRRNPRDEREGFVNGKCVVDLDSPNFSGGEDSFTPSDIGSPMEEDGCPFSSMMGKLEKMQVDKSDIPLGHSNIG
ncbi:hypothetical protein BLS_002196 [Venturia inaequalis]|uniref:Globin-sensor domain-containing protein n=1 Tax=Venturia inaequalis TaxID=5025 RepID=A0A8H3V8L1_VENIN|nr:hypothetical protein BLS_002196 [Venturia inaequalis]KAE9989939.1 hypothetical protein EG327_002081 [Venturia inaequalis]RDI85177.1 hypothetical protein Vi05172_g4647 [Venturia inaequalis]